jgi:hypothetical protein
MVEHPIGRAADRRCAAGAESHQRLSQAVGCISTGTLGARCPEALTPDTPLVWSSWGKRTVGRTSAPMKPKNIWHLCKTFGTLTGYPEL